MVPRDRRCALEMAAHALNRAGGVGVGGAWQKSQKHLQYQYVCAEPPKADID